MTLSINPSFYERPLNFHKKEVSKESSVCLGFEDKPGTLRLSKIKPTKRIFETKFSQIHSYLKNQVVIFSKKIEEVDPKSLFFFKYNIQEWNKKVESYNHKIDRSFCLSNLNRLLGILTCFQYTLKYKAISVLSLPLQDAHKAPVQSKVKEQVKLIEQANIIEKAKIAEPPEVGEPLEVAQLPTVEEQKKPKEAGLDNNPSKAHTQVLSKRIATLKIAEKPSSPVQSSTPDVVSKKNENVVDIVAKAKKSIHEPTKVFTCMFKDESDQIVAIETAKRVNTVSLLLKGMRSYCSSLKGKIALKSTGVLYCNRHQTSNLDRAKAPGFNDRKGVNINNMDPFTIVESRELSHGSKSQFDADCSITLKFLQQEVVRIEEKIATFALFAKNETWASTNSPRFLFKSQTRDMAKKIGLPVLVNLHAQSIQKSETPDGKLWVNRMGAISVFSHGEISLQELKDIALLEKIHENVNKKAKSIQIHPRLDAFYDFRKKNKDIDSNKLKEIITILKLKALIGYGPEALTNNPDTKIKKLVTELIEENWILKPEYQSKYGKALDKLVFDVEKLETVINERRELLRMQFLQNLFTHFENRKVHEAETVYLHTSLLDLKKQGKNDFGCILHERTQGLDMAALFEEIDGDIIMFDVEDSGGPYFDEKGIIHMPRTCQEGNLEKTTLHTVFYNICVQGEIANTGIQAYINEQAVCSTQILAGSLSEDKRKEFNIHYNDLQKALVELKSGDSDPFEGCLSLNLAFFTFDAYQSINCYGGKDRTAYLRALISDYFLRQTNPSSELLKRWRKLLVGKDGIAIQIAYENAGQNFLKLTRVDLKLYDGIFDRAKVAIKFLSKNKNAKDGLSIGSGIGQLYQC
ncbi:MAG: hypothetical protein H0W88_10305 [Parachlamydiaceae bacterium]|nr:hypothetical protein [Parachlamydiaceae bacterium]